MTKFEIVEAKSKSDLDELYNCSALTIEGLDPDSIPDFVDHIIEKGGTVKKVVDIPGRLMNKVYGLTGTNAYPDNLDIVSVIGNTLPLTMDRFNWGGRWFDDIVSNNARREEEAW